MEVRVGGQDREVAGAADGEDQEGVAQARRHAREKTRRQEVLYIICLYMYMCMYAVDGDMVESCFFLFFFQLLLNFWCIIFTYQSGGVSESAPDSCCGAPRLAKPVQLVGKARFAPALSQN